MTGRAGVLQGDARHLPLPDASVDLIVTSPPYWVQRDYHDRGVSMPGQIGSEATPGDWLAVMWDCTRDWVRVLKPTGSMFVNLGDKTINKRLTGLPWRYALGCIDQLGLILRAEIIWAKPNGLPESVTDRVRRAHEQVFHFTKQPRYYAAIDEIREPHTEVRSGHESRNPHTRSAPAMSPVGVTWVPPERFQNPLGKLPGSVWSIPSAPLQVPTRLGVDHFAAFPPALVRPLVLGWSPPGICTACGEGRRPIVHKEGPDPDLLARRGYSKHTWSEKGPRGKLNSYNINSKECPLSTAFITGYTCGCDTPWPLGSVQPSTRPATVLDPFGGTGTTALVAAVHGRTGISIDRSADYTRLAHWRTHDPAERARALGVPKPPPIPDGQDSLFPELT